MNRLSQVLEDVQDPACAEKLRVHVETDVRVSLDAGNDVRRHFGLKLEKGMKTGWLERFVADDLLELGNVPGSQERLFR